MFTSKGDRTRERILEKAFEIAARDGLDGLSIGGLAAELEMSKSGLFAHFKSKEELQIDVLRTATARFEARVVRPALRAARGVPRLRALFEGWLRWLTDSPGGCFFVAASTELDDRDGRPRDLLVADMGALFTVIARIVRGAVQQKHLRADIDPEQVAFELYGIVLACHNATRLMRHARAVVYARAAFERLITSTKPGVAAA